LRNAGGASKLWVAEGQRKAAFEDCEAERKSNVDEIHKLKRDIAELVKELKEKTEATAALKAFAKRLEAVVGPFDDKGVDDIRGLLDLHIIDKNKVFDLVQYRIRKVKSERGDRKVYGEKVKSKDL
jgi:hypothetical protein